MKQVEEALHQLHAREKEKHARDEAEALAEAMSQTQSLPQAFAKVNAVTPGSPANISVSWWGLTAGWEGFFWIQRENIACDFLCHLLISRNKLGVSLGFHPPPPTFFFVFFFFLGRTGMSCA